ncbi:hypothetical protein B0E33_10740 [Roseibium algicola]|uniref:Uncharacterized protein n=1 Tax=Roseibium algicola TaxID=2857014 RepID=A0ABM6I0Y5_9HYPH|nr:hypothetical protein B0E33_10740 [Roseibium aggregatum]
MDFLQVSIRSDRHDALPLHLLILRSRPCGISKDGPLAPEFAAHPSRQRCALPQDEEVRKTTADGLVQGMGFTTRTSRS